jgi:alanine racemase
MQTATRPVWAEIDIDTLTHNIGEVRRVTEPSAEIMAVVKANAYGHGAVQCSRVFLENGAKSLAVATLSEAVELRGAGVEAPILVLGYTPVEHFGETRKWGVTPTIYTLSGAKALADVAESVGKVAKAHIKVDTGLGRIGFLPSDESLNAIEEVAQFPSLEIEGIFTHFAIADVEDKEYTRGQFEAFLGFTERLEARGISPLMRHVSNSAAIIDLPECSLDAVRPGCMLYGLYPSDEVDTDRVDLWPSMTLRTRLSNVKVVPPGTGISYGLTYTTGAESVIGSLPVGYADGYSRALSNRAEVLVKGKRASIVGRVCMDQCMVDLTRVEGAGIGDDIVLFGGGVNGAPTVEDVAGWMGSITDEVVCTISRRVPRVYLKGGEAVEIVDYVRDGAENN